MVQVKVTRKDDELAHAYKYTSKKWKNGKWYYTYEIDVTDNYGRKIGKETKTIKGVIANAKYRNKLQDTENQDAYNAKEKAKAERAARNKSIKREADVLNKDLQKTGTKTNVKSAKNEFKKHIDKGKKKLNKILGIH